MKKIITVALVAFCISTQAQAAFDGVPDRDIMKYWAEAKETCAHGNPEMSGTTQSCALINDAAGELYNRGYRWRNGHWKKVR